MADAVVMEPDMTVLEQAITAMPEALRDRMLEACEQTSSNIVREAQSRLRRQLSGAATGQTVAGIHYIKAYDGNGFVILSDRGGDQIANLPLWLEKGTRAGLRRSRATTKPRPFFYSSIELEANAHERRVLDGMRASAADVGLGE